MSSEQTSSGETPSEYALLAAKHGLTQQVGRPPLGKYLRDLWASRNFIWSLASTRTYARNENTYLGQLWSIINPLLYAAVYYVVFGVVLDTSKGIDNFPGFLIVGVFVFQFCSAALSNGSGGVVNNIAMIRSLRFPRAALPISVVVTEFLTLLPAIAVMFVVVGLTGEPPQWSWLLAVPMMLVITVFNVGVALLMSRIVSQQRDVKNLIPFATQMLRYLSGLFYSIQHVVGEGLLGVIFTYQPYALALDVVRGCLLSEFALSWVEALAMCAWAVLLFVGGLIYFWRAEGKYGVE